MNGTDKLSKNHRLPWSRFVKRMYLMRIPGTFLCFIPILSVLTEHQRSVWLMLLLALNAFVWPTVAPAARQSVFYAAGRRTSKSGD